MRIVEVSPERLVLGRQLEVAVEQPNENNAHDDPNRAGYRSGYESHHS
jgi:hypothetical protein